MNTGLKIFLFAVGAVIIVLFIALGISMGSTGKAIADMGTFQVKEVAEDKMSMLKAKYDENSILGSELVSLIDETISNADVLSIVVLTLDTTRTDYNYTYQPTTATISKTDATTAVTDSITNIRYFNRNSLYQCEVKTDLNGNVICLWFEQEK